ncbi:GlyGly-CTERM sorting domain-containing protein [Burkholderia gladioli]|uniref:GlyGly-CTERM sorting domain-containing protein n=1 Tax=Burkholderia gladioli TaxID=28095 RepID=UPI003C7EB487
MPGSSISGGALAPLALAPLALAAFRRCQARHRDGDIALSWRNCRLKFDRLLKPTW